jgi:hypothetical protein
VDARANLDFGPGFHLNPHFIDAKNWCEYHIAPFAGSQAAILIFQIPMAVYNAWIIHELDYITSEPNLNGLTEWQYFVQQCPTGEINNRTRSRYDGFSGPQCSNPHQLPTRTAKPRYTNEISQSLAWQISLHSSNAQAQIMDHLTSVVTFTNIPPPLSRLLFLLLLFFFCYYTCCYF